MKRSLTDGIRTIAIHAGDNVAENSKPSAPSIVMSSTFLADRAGSFSAMDYSNGSMPLTYTRWGNPTISQLEETLRALEEAEACVTFASGMGATSALLFGLLSAGDHMIVSDVNYAGTAELMRSTLPRFGISVDYVDTSNPQSVANSIRPETKLVFIETPSNPILKVSDIRTIAHICSDAKILLAVDSTFATPILTKPLALGADFVVHSLTKYIGGHGDALGGALLGPADRIAALRQEALVHYGGVISPFNAWLIMRGIATLPLRMSAVSTSALKIAEALETRPGVRRVIYPGLRSHPQHDVARRQMQAFSGIISFQVDDGPAVAERMIKELRLIHYAVSLGHHRSLIYWIGAEDILNSTYQLRGKSLEAFTEIAGEGIMRLSVGLEDTHDLLSDLDRVLP